jgi:hypothetical protein
MEISQFFEKRFAMDPSMVFRKIGGECLLVPIRRNVADLESIYVLNEVGGYIWELIDGQRMVATIKDSIVSEFEVSPQVIAEQDLVEFLTQLFEIGGIREV